MKSKNLQNLAMITYFDVKRRAVAVDVALVESTGGAKLPGTYGVDALHHGVERVVLIPWRRKSGAYEKEGSRMCPIPRGMILWSDSSDGPLFRH